MKIIIVCETLLREVKDALLLTKEAGIDMYAFFLVGYPGETLETVERSFDLIREVRPTDVSFAVVIPLPGTALWDYLAENKFISYSTIDWDYLFAKTGRGKYENYAAELASGWCDIKPQELIKFCRLGEEAIENIDGYRHQAGNNQAEFNN